MDVNGCMAADVNGSTAESQSRGGSNGNGHSHHHHHQQQGYTLFLGPDVGTAREERGEVGGEGEGEAGDGGAVAGARVPGNGGVGAGPAASGGGVGPMGGKLGRDFRRTNWTAEECLVLQDAKREDYERQTSGNAKEKRILTAAERWLAVEDFCWAHKVHRSGQQCKDRWEKMSADYKKVYDYETRVTNGQTRFWQMSLEEKKAKRLPSTFFIEVYKGLAQWFGRPGAAGSSAATPTMGGGGLGRARVDIQVANGALGNLGSLLREREGSIKEGSNGNYSVSDEGESEGPAATDPPMFDSIPGKKRNSDGEVLIGDRNGGASGRDYRRTNWTLTESLVLQAAKREDFERQYGNPAKDKHLSAAERWQVVEEYCWSRAVHRSGQQCRDRWDKLSSDYKKISDHEKQILNGQCTYWMMTPEEKKNKRLPSTFWVEVFTAMGEWFGKSRNIDLRVMIHDSSQPAPREASGNEDFFGTDDEGSDPGSAPGQDSSAEKDRKSDRDGLVGGDGKHGREYTRLNWALQECMILQSAMQDEFERQVKDKHWKAEDTWQVVEDFCWAQSVYRSSQQCKEKWDKVSGEFKKIYSYQRRVGGENPYWMLTGEEKMTKRLPMTFWKEVFYAMVKWFPGERIGSGPGECSESDGRDSDPVSDDAFQGFRPSKRSKSMSSKSDSLAAIMEKSSLATQKALLECEDRKDRRLEKSIEADVQRLERTLEANEKIAMSYCSAFVALAEAIRSITNSASHD